MRYPADEKLEIIRLVENSHLGVKRTLDKLGLARPAFYRWYAMYLARGEAGSNNYYRGPARPWNRLPEEVRARLIELALKEPEFSPRKLAVRFTHAQGYYVSESTVYRLQKAHHLITSPAFVVIKAAN
jgi:transposase-like protein